MAASAGHGGPDPTWTGRPSQAPGASQHNRASSWLVRFHKNQLITIWDNTKRRGKEETTVHTHADTATLGPPPQKVGQYAPRVVCHHTHQDDSTARKWVTSPLATGNTHVAKGLPSSSASRVTMEMRPEPQGGATYTPRTAATGKR